VPKANKNTPVKITVNIQPGKLSPAQQQQWNRAWTRLIAEAKNIEFQERGHDE
jgi:hypothetical protein